MFGQAWYSAAPCTPSHPSHTFPPENAARCEGLCNALHRPSQRAAMRNAPHYVFCLTLVRNSPPCAQKLHPTLSIPSQSLPYSYQKCRRWDWTMREDGMKNRPGTTTLPCFCSRRDWHAEMKQSGMRGARTVTFPQVFGTTSLPSCSKVQAGRREH